MGGEEVGGGGRRWEEEVGGEEEEEVCVCLVVVGTYIHVCTSVPRSNDKRTASRGKATHATLKCRARALRCGG